MESIWESWGVSGYLKDLTNDTEMDSMTFHLSTYSQLKPGKGWISLKIQTRDSAHFMSVVYIDIFNMETLKEEDL